MSIPIKFDRSVRPEWMDFALETLCSTGFDLPQSRKVVREHLDGQIAGAVALDKTLTQIFRVVAPNDVWSQEQLLALREQMGEVASSGRTSFRLQLLRTIPFFNDFCATLSRMAGLGTTQMTLAPVQQRINATYGDRPIIRRSLFFAFQTLAWMGVVEQVGREWKIVRPDLLKA